MTTGPIHEHLDIFEAEIEPKLKIKSPQRRERAFRILRTFLARISGSSKPTRGVSVFFAGNLGSGRRTHRIRRASKL